MSFVVGEQFRRGAAPKFFEFLGELARDAELSIWQDVDASVERFRQTIRRFEKDRCLFARGGCAQLALASAAFDRKKPTEEKFVGRKSGADQRCENRGGSWNNCERQLALDAFANQSRARIGKARRPRVGNKRNLFAGREPLDQLSRAHRFVVLMITNQRLVDLVTLQENSGMARVLRCDKIDIFQNLQGAQCDIAKISNRCGNDVKHLGLSKAKALAQNELIKRRRL